MTNYHTSYDTCFSSCLVLVVPIYFINHLLVSAILFSFVLLSGRYSHQLPASDPSNLLVTVLAPSLRFFYQHVISNIRFSYQLVTRGNSTI